MSKLGVPHRERAIGLLKARGMARSSELRAAGITPATVARMERTGEIVRVDRGVYQLADAPLEEHHSIAEVSALAPHAVICLVSALTVHGLTDKLPRQVWIAIGYAARRPKVTSTPIRVVRMSEHLLGTDVETHTIENVPVRVFGVAKTVADCFRLMRHVGRNTALEGLREALSQRLTTPGALADAARAGRCWTIMRPYLEAMTSSA